MELTAKQLAHVLRGTVDGDENAVATKFAKIEHGRPGTLSFFANPKYEPYVYTSKASILLVSKDFEPKEPVTPTMVRVDNAYTAIAELLKYVSDKKKKARRHRSLRADGSLPRSSANRSISETSPMSAIIPASETIPSSTRMSISGMTAR